MSKGKYYITTAIAYTSKVPHIGNVYEAVLADNVARFKRQEGYDVFFMTGTDEHGQKIQQQAKEEGVEPLAYVDHVAGEIKRIWDMMGTSYDKFIRTTDADHVETVQKIFKRLYDQGDIYKGKYEGLYCTPCESFFTDSQLVEGKCPDCGREVIKASEEAYFFKLSKYADRLTAHIEAHPEFIWPESRKNEMMNNFIKPGLQDLCVSRTTFDWGIPVSFDNRHVVYVWIDALSNYITGLGYNPEGESGDLFKHYWPADMHLIGKDILRFHTIYWPIMLMALDVPLPKQVFGHPWFLFGQDKMSKSRGNTLYADDLVRRFGVDAIRYFLLHEMPFANDGSITNELIISRINSDLANVLGNLVNRTVAMVHKYFDGHILAPQGGRQEVDDELKLLAMGVKAKVIDHMSHYRVAEALDEIWVLLRRSNKYIDETAPWILAKDELQKDRLATVLYNLLECIRIAGVCLKSFMPETADKIIAQLGKPVDTWESLNHFGGMPVGTSVGTPEPLFARIDEAKMMKEINEEIEAKKAADEAKYGVKPAPEKPIDIVVDKVEEVTNDEIAIDDFLKVQMRVGKVIESARVEKSDKLLVSKIQVGDEVRQIVSGIAKDFAPEDFVGSTVIVVTNLKPVKLRGVLSEGMILAATGADGKVKLVTTDKEVPTGTRIG